MICRVEAAWTLHPATRALLLEMAAEYDVAVECEEQARRRGEVLIRRA